MKVLVACERFGAVRSAFRVIGIDAWSCDTSDDIDLSPFHIKGDVLDILDDGWDMMIAHPPCTHLSVSGAHLWKKKREDGRQQAAMEFFSRLYEADIPRICVENPVGIMTRVYGKPQYIQPWQFGHLEAKKTGLWLKGLPELVPTDIMDKPECGYWENQTPSGQNKLGPSKDRAMKRAKTYAGVALAMAQQWGMEEL